MFWWSDFSFIDILLGAMSSTCVMIYNQRLKFQPVCFGAVVRRRSQYLQICNSRGMHMPLSYSPYGYPLMSVADISQCTQEWSRAWGEARGGNWNLDGAAQSSPDRRKLWYRLWGVSNVMFALWIENEMDNWLYARWDYTWGRRWEALISIRARQFGFFLFVWRIAFTIQVVICNVFVHVIG